MGEYAERDHAAQGQHYLRHVEAMTDEGLHLKSDIAGELAHRDIEIEKLRAELKEARQALRRAEDAKFSSFMAGLGPSRWE